MVAGVDVLVVIVLGFCLVFALVYQDRPRLLLKPGRRQKVTPRALGEPVAVLLVSPFLVTPMVLFIPDERAQLAGSPLKVLLVAAAFPVGYWLVKLLSPARHTSRRLVLAGKALGVVAAVVAVEMLARSVGVPVLSMAGPLVVLAVVAATASLACLRLVAFGYWPTRLVRLGLGYLVAVAVVVALSTRAHGRLLPDLRADWFVAALELAVFAVACTAVVVGCLRRSRWLRGGPPASPAPPAVTDWPPEEGEVWLAILTHDDELRTHKERPVLVWDTTPTHVEVLTITSRPKTGDRRYLPLPLSEWQPVLTKSSWLALEPTPLPYAEFIAFKGTCPVGGMGDRLDRAVRGIAGTRPGFDPRRLRALAGNRHVGPHQETVSEPVRRTSRSSSR